MNEADIIGNTMSILDQLWPALFVCLAVGIALALGSQMAKLVRALLYDATPTYTPRPAEPPAPPAPPPQPEPDQTAEARSLVLSLLKLLLGFGYLLFDRFFPRRCQHCSQVYAGYKCPNCGAPRV